jgi:hypothetical protein
MTAAEYRKRAELLLRSRHPADLPDSTVRQAEVWACLAVAAAVSEQQTHLDVRLVDNAATAVLDDAPLRTLHPEQEGSR